MSTDGWIALAIAAVMGLCVGCRGNPPTAAGPTPPEVAAPSASRPQGGEDAATAERAHTELATAAMDDDIARVRQLLASGADPNAKDATGTRPLHWATVRDSTEVARLLLENGADINGKDRAGQTPLHTAAASMSLAAAELLIHRGADVNAEDVNRSTPLHEAAMRGSADMERLLLRAGARVNAMDIFGNTPLHWAASDALEPEAVAVLEEHGGIR